MEKFPSWMIKGYLASKRRRQPRIVYLSSSDEETKPSQSTTPKKTSPITTAVASATSLTPKSITNSSTPKSITNSSTPTSSRITPIIEESPQSSLSEANEKTSSFVKKRKRFRSEIFQSTQDG